MQEKGLKINFEETVKGLDDLFIRSKDRGLYKFVVSQVERPLIERILERTQGNQIKAAKILGINRNTLHSKIRKLGINVLRWKR